MQSKYLSIRNLDCKLHLICIINRECLHYTLMQDVNTAYRCLTKIFTLIKILYIKNITDSRQTVKIDDLMN